MYEHVSQQLDHAETAVFHAYKQFLSEHYNGSTIIPDLYPIMGRLVTLISATRDFLGILPDLLAFNPAEYYDSQGLNPREPMASAEFARRDARDLLYDLGDKLNETWSHIGRLGLKSPEGIDATEGE